PDLLLALGQGVVREDGGYLPAPAFRVRRATRPPDRAACDGPRPRDRPDGSAKYAAGSTSPASPKRGACRGARRRGGRALNASRSDSAPIPETTDVGDVMAAAERLRRASSRRRTRSERRGAQPTTLEVSSPCHASPTPRTVPPHSPFPVDSGASASIWCAIDTRRGHARIAQAGGIGGPARGSDSASSAAAGPFCARPGDGAKVSAHGDHVPYGQVQLPVSLLPSAADEPR